MINQLQKIKQIKNHETEQPDKFIEKFINRSKGFALDIGAGTGRNSLFLAKKGFVVEAIDKSNRKLKIFKKYIKEENIKNIKIKKINILKFHFKKNKYNLIIACYSLDFFKKSEVKFLIKKIKQSLSKKGIIFLSVFSTKENSYKLAKQKLKEIEKRTFYFPKIKGYRNFFTKSELKNYFSNFKILYLNQKQIQDYHDSINHSHNIIQLIAKKEEE